MKKECSIIDKFIVVSCVGSLFVVFPFVGCTAIQRSPTHDIISEYVALFPEEHKLELAIQNVAYGLQREERTSEDVRIIELEEEIFSLMKQYRANEFGIYARLREVHTTLLYPSLSEKQQKFFQKFDYQARAYAYVEHSRRINFFDLPILWVETRGIAPQIKEFTAIGTLVFEVTSKERRQTTAVVFKISHNRASKKWRLLYFTHKTW